MAAIAFAIQISTSYSSISSLQIENRFLLKTGVHIRPKTTSSKRISLVRASSKPQRGGGADAANDKAALVSQEDLKYLVQLGAGSIAGAAAIKYGSIIFPEITSPNLVQALLMITAPVVVAVVLLIKQSRDD